MHHEKVFLDYVKIENFKSYKNSIFFGPMSQFSCITGKNGSGKTNFSDSLLFALGSNLEDINCTNIQILFPDNISDKNFFLEAKIGLRIKNENRKNDFIRTLSIDNLSEFFVNGTKVSLEIYKKSLEKLNLFEFKNFIILKDILQNDFFKKKNKLSYIIDKLSSSKKLCFAQLKFALLRKKFQKNAFFYFQKLKYVLNERIHLLEKQKKIILFKKTQKKFKTIEKNDILFKIINLMYKIWRLFKKKKKNK